MNKRLKLLERWHLLVRVEGSGYRRSQILFTPSREGRRLIDAFRGDRGTGQLLDDLDEACRRTRGKREQTISVAHLELLRLVAHEGERTVTSLLPHFSHAKPTLRSRLQYLEGQGLVERQEKSNRGGNSWPTHFDATQSGRALLRLVAPR